MNPGLRRLLFIPLVFAIVLLACEFSASTASITNAVTAKDSKSDTFEPVGITDTFPPDQVKFHAVVSIANAPDDTKLKAVWTAMDVGTAAAPNTVIDSSEITAGGTRNVDFTLSPDAGKVWPAGTYKVDIYLNGKMNRSLNFSVVAPPQPTAAATRAPTAVPTVASVVCPPVTLPAARPSGIVTGVTMALNTQGANKDPVNPTNLFPPSAVFHAVVALKDAPANTQVTATWYASDLGGPPDCNVSLTSTDITTDGTRNIDFTLTPPSVWPDGDYRVEISVNNTFDRAVRFQVSKNAPPVPTAGPTQPPATLAPKATLSLDTPVPPTKAPPTATRVPPTAPPTATEAAAANPCNLQPGQSGILFTNTYDFEVLLTIGGGEWGTHDFRFQKGTKPIQFPPGNYTATLTIPGKGNYKFSNDKVTFEAGVCYPFTTPQ